MSPCTGISIVCYKSILTFASTSLRESQIRTGEVDLLPPAGNKIRTGGQN